jgi:hypothetical protein
MFVRFRRITATMLIGCVVVGLRRHVVMLCGFGMTFLGHACILSLAG